MFAENHEFLPINCMMLDNSGFSICHLCLGVFTDCVYVVMLLMRQVIASVSRLFIAGVV